jgi:hypothetical protein
MVVKVSSLLRKKRRPFVSAKWKRALNILTALALILCFFGSAPVRSQETYPNVEISGYKKYEYQQIGVTPGTNYFLGAQHLGSGYGFTSGPWQERLQLRIVGKLSKRLSVSYDLEQQPEMPERYHVKVNYDNHELVFGDFNANFGGNEFASASKSLNGVLITSYDTWYNLTLVPSAKNRSYTQSLTAQKGTNTAGPYNIGHTSIMEGSEYVELNGVKLKKDADYTIDYFEGKITFKRILSSADEFKYSYEYTNIIDIFFPAVSKRDFFGYRGDYTFDPTEFGKEAPKEEPVIRSGRESFPSYILEPDYVTVESYLTPSVEVTGTVESGIPAGTILINGKDVMTIHDIGAQLPAIDRARIIAGRIASIASRFPTPEAIFTLGSIEGEYVGLVGEKVVFTIDKREAGIWGVAPHELGETWISKLNESLEPKIIIEVIEVPKEVEEIPPEFEEEETGTYQLKNRPIVMFSESIVFEGTRLKKDVDYSINYETGMVRMLMPTLPTLSNKMNITYRYYLIAEESEILPGIGSRGPYDLAHREIIPGSERVVVSEIPNVRDLDYTIDYETGKILFYYNILSTQNINVRYRHVEKRLPPPPKEEGPDQTLRVGTTYLKETAKKGEGLPTEFGSEIYNTPGELNEIINNDNTIHLLAYPIAGSSVVITLNGSQLAEGVDYVIPSTEVVSGRAETIPAGIRIGFRTPPNYEIEYLNDPLDLTDGEDSGTIKLLRTLESTFEVKVSYTYYKSVYNTIRLSGDVSNKGPYSLSGARGMLPGREEVKVWNESAQEYQSYSPNPSIEVNTGHYSINYADLLDPTITFNDYPTVGKSTFIINFWYVPQSAPSGRDISQDMLGLDATYSVGDFFKLESSVAKSQIDQVYGAVTTSETFLGDEGRIYNLGFTDIIEDSEKVYINEDLQNKDTNYAISYAGGLLTFFNNISSAETIRIDYDYQDAGVGDIKKKEGYAYKFAASGKVGESVDLHGSFRKVDYDFVPMGGIPLGAGSDSKDFGFGYRPFKNMSLSGNYKQTNDLVTQRYKDKFIHREEWSLSTSSDIADMLDLSLGFRQSSSIDDELPENLGIHNNDERSDFWSMGLSPKPIKYGEVTYTNRNDMSKSLSYTDTEDKLLPTTTTVDYLRTSNVFKFSDWADFSVDYQLNEPIKVETTVEASVTKEVETEHTRSVDISYTTNLDLTKFARGTIKRFTTMARFNTFNKDDLIAKSLTSTRNQTLRFDLTPFNELTATYQNDRQETPSAYIENLGNPGYERTYSTIRYSPLSNVGLGWSGNWDENVQDNGAQSRSTSNTYSIDYKPVIPKSVLGISLPTENLSVTTRASRTQRWSSSTPYEGSRSITRGRTNTGDVGLTYYPHPLLTITSGMNVEMYWNNVEPDGVDTDTVNLTYRAGTIYRPDPKWNLSANYNRKETTDRKTWTTLPKEVIDAHATYKVFTYGSLTYDWEREMNRGEVLAGSISELDLLKMTNGLTFTVSIPQNNVVLNSIRLDATWKQVEYEDRLSPGNNFTANRLSFEGTLNF